MPAIDFKKTQKELYAPKSTPSLIDVSEMVFFMVDGQGDPNTSIEYSEAVEALYALSYAIKMSKNGDEVPEGYFDYVVPPLEGLWSLNDGGKFVGSGETIMDKSKFVWTSMLRQPDFVTPEVFEWAKEKVSKKKTNLDISNVRYAKFTEGFCAQVMHLGPYDDEPATIAKLSKFIRQQGFVEDMAGERRHHEIYLSDPRKTAPEKTKTIIRHPVK